MKKTLKEAVIFSGLVFFCLAGIFRTAEAATFTVNSTADEVDTNPGDGICATAAGTCTLRAAIHEANALLGADTINLPAGTYTLTIAGTSEDAAATGDLDITDDLTLIGAGQDDTAIDANQLERIFDILHILPAPAPTVNISSVTIQNGNAPYGGGLYNGGTLTLTDSVVIRNQANSNQGGGLFNAGPAILTNVTISNNAAQYDTGGGIYNEQETLTISGSTISNNTSGENGGGIFNQNGTLTISDSIISNNTAQYENGGGIDNYGSSAVANISNTVISGNIASNGNGGGIDNGSVSGAQMTLTDCTISGNSARLGGGISNTGNLNVVRSTISGNTSQYDGGGINNASGGGLYIINSTISGNISQATDSGGGIFNGGTVYVDFTTITNNRANPGGGILTWGSARLYGSIVAGNTADDCAVSGTGSFWSLGYNIGGDASCDTYFTQTTDLRSTNPNLGPLTDNGGPTQTHALLAGSPAIDAVPQSQCFWGEGAPMDTDQRGVSRPQGIACDIGAFEVQAAPQRTFTLTKSGNGRVTSTPPGIDCGSDCSEAFPDGTTVNLSANPDPGYYFAGWSGDPDCADGSITMDADKNCTATFNPLPTLTITIGPNSPPAGTTYTKGSNRPMLQFVATAGSYQPTSISDSSEPANGPPTEAVRITNITLQASGTGNDQTGITAVKVWLDANGNGQMDGGDTQVGSGTYNADNGTVTITFTPAQVIPAGQYRTYLITYDLVP